MQLRQLSKADAVSLLELIDSSAACVDISSFKKLFSKIKNLIPHEYSACELSKSSEEIVETSQLVNLDFPREYMVMYQRNNWRRIDPIQKDAIGQPRARYWADIFLRRRLRLVYAVPDT